jgi:carbamoyltransferase
MRILGISAFYHDSAAALIDSGNIVAAAQEERFSRLKQDKRFPNNSIDFILKESKMKINDIDAIVYYENPRIKLDRLLSSYIEYAPTGRKSFIQAMTEWSGGKLFIEKIIRDKLKYDGKVNSVLHHESHAASAFYPSPFKSSAIITADGVGEWQTTTYGVGNGNSLEIIGSIDFPHSIGMLYSAMTQFLGFKVNSGEYKVMGLAPYGTPKYANLIMTKIVEVYSDGSIKLNLDYFDFIVGESTISAEWEKLFKRKKRMPESNLTQDDMDLAASIQWVTETIMIKIAKFVKNQTKEKNLCLAGGVALNCVANGKIDSEMIFENIWIQPAAGDSGGALGSALFYWYKTLNQSRTTDAKKDSMQGSYLGPKYQNEDIEQFLISFNIPYKKIENPSLTAAKLLSEGKIIGWFQGRMEFGPRSLGSRSILGDARSPEMQKNMNLKIKFRESFRPFAPAVIEEEAKEWFDIKSNSPYMLLVSSVLDKHRTQLNDYEKNLFGIEKLNQIRSSIPAITHVDYSARVQTVSKQTNPKFWELISEFKKLTNVPVIVNTSFNVRGEPIVCSPEDAYNCFIKTNIDFLILENLIIENISSLPEIGILNSNSQLMLD